MVRLALLLQTLCSFFVIPAGAEPAADMKKEILILWQASPQQGSIEIACGQLLAPRPAAEQAQPNLAHADFKTTSPARLPLAVFANRLAAGPGGTRVSVRQAERSFSFFLRDVRADFPIFIPEYGVIVTAASETRNYATIAADLRGRGLKTKLEQYEAEPEHTWEGAAARTRRLNLPIWLGLTRDTRLFEIETQHNQRMHDALKYEHIIPRHFSTASGLDFFFMLGKGSNAAETMEHRLDEGSLPILRGTRQQDEIEYELLAFATLERSPLTMANVRGTDHLVSHYQVGGNCRDALTTDQLQLAEKLLPAETSPELEQPILYFRATARNTGRAPHYAYFLAPNPNTRLDAERGYYMTADDQRVAVLATFNGQPLPNEEISVLLAPGETATLECRIPHQPLTPERALQVATQDFAMRLEECRRFWRAKLESGTQIEVPERKINELIQAGLLHLDLLCFGREPDGPVAAATGYAPIGTESSPIIQFLDSMGHHALAGRALLSFLDKQHEDGFMQNFGNYQCEVGPVLWTIGEHWRYTRDEAWARAVAPRALKACEYLIKRRHREGDAMPRGRGYGMFCGNMGDPVDPFPSFALNGYACLGLARVAEMLETIEPVSAARLKNEAEAYRADIRENFFVALAESPAVPLGDGSWAPTAPPWAGESGAALLYTAPGQRHYFTHGSFMQRDGHVGPIYLPFTEILSPTEQPVARWLAEVQAEMFSVGNSVPTQPYYSRNPWLLLKQDRVRPFLRAYYDTVTSTIDRGIYTFQEHPYGGAIYKTHEEGWFLMQTRWMLWMEEGQRLRLLAGIPRVWLKNGERIRLKDAASYFGPVSLNVESNLSKGVITADVSCTSDRKPREIWLRLPHPEGKRATGVTGGAYDAKDETVRVADFNGRARIDLKFE